MLQYTFLVHVDMLCESQNSFLQLVQVLQPVRNYLEIGGLYFR